MKMLKILGKYMAIGLLTAGSLLVFKSCQAEFAQPVDTGDGWVCHQRLVQRGNARIGTHECVLRVTVDGVVREYSIPDEVKTNVAHTYNNTHTET